MKFFFVIIGLLAVLVAMPAMANNYSVVFTNNMQGGAVVGSGTFSFGAHVGDGTYSILDLDGFAINFHVGNATFTNENIATDLNHVLITVYNDGAQFYFNNDGEGYGDHGGSLDFDGMYGSYLTTEPGYYGQGPLTLYAAGDGDNNFFGTYQQGVAAPEPASMFLLGSGLLVATARKFKR